MDKNATIEVNSKKVISAKSKESEWELGVHVGPLAGLDKPFEKIEE